MRFAQRPTDRTEGAACQGARLNTGEGIQVDHVKTHDFFRPR
jgi:hypothetical protein